MVVTRSMMKSSSSAPAAPVRHQRVYVDNAVNRRLQRVGMPYGYVAPAIQPPTEPTRVSRRLRGLTPEVPAQPTGPVAAQRAPEVPEAPAAVVPVVQASRMPQGVSNPDVPEPVPAATEVAAALPQEEPRVEDGATEDLQQFNLMVGVEVTQDIDAFVDKAVTLEALNAVSGFDLAALLDGPLTLSEEETDGPEWSLDDTFLEDIVEHHPLFDEFERDNFQPDILFSLED